LRAGGFRPVWGLTLIRLTPITARR
jgi:hypothetical protein